MISYFRDKYEPEVTNWPWARSLTPHREEIAISAIDPNRIVVVSLAAAIF
jgi:hypothetical protein